MQNMTVDDIIDGIVKITLNAQSLVDEAELLLKNKYHALAYTLALRLTSNLDHLVIKFEE